VRKYHAQPKFANDTTKQGIDEYTNNNSNLGGKTLKGRTFHYTDRCTALAVRTLEGFGLALKGPGLGLEGLYYITVKRVNVSSLILSSAYGSPIIVVFFSQY